MVYNVQLVAAKETPSQVLENIVTSVPTVFPFPLQFIVEPKRYSVGEPSIENPYFIFDTSSKESFVYVPAVLQDYSQKHPLLLLLHQPYALDMNLENIYRKGYIQGGDFAIGGSCQTETVPCILTAAIRKTASAGNLIVAAHEIAHSVSDSIYDSPWVTEDGIKSQRSHCDNYIRKKGCIMNPSPEVVKPSPSLKDNALEHMHMSFCPACIETLERGYKHLALFNRDMCISL